MIPDPFIIGGIYSLLFELPPTEQRWLASWLHIIPDPFDTGGIHFELYPTKQISWPCSIMIPDPFIISNLSWMGERSGGIVIVRMHTLSSCALYMDF